MGKGKLSKGARAKELAEKLAKSADSYLDMGYKELDEKLQVLMGRGLSGNAYQLFMDENDLYGKPSVVPDGEIDRLVADGAIELFRGMPNSDRMSGADKLMDIMTDGPYFSGTGVYANGIYMTDQFDLAEIYARQDGSICRAVLKKDAVGVSYYSIRSIASDYLVEADYKDTMMEESALAIFARSRGYDYIINTSGYGNVTILNREALVFSDTLRQRTR